MERPPHDARRAEKEETTASADQNSKSPELEARQNPPSNFGPQPHEREYDNEDFEHSISLAASDDQRIPRLAAGRSITEQTETASEISEPFVDYRAPSSHIEDAEFDDEYDEFDDLIESETDGEDVVFAVVKMTPPTDPTEGCQHYKRRCQKKAYCCGKFFPCRICHNDQMKGQCSEEMDRKKVTEIRCNKCLTEQRVSNTCVKCGIQFGSYYCGICHFFDNEDKQQYHCDGCGICRVGGRANFIHCDKCCACYAVAYFDHHKCVEHALERNCPVCLEFLQTSRKPLHVPKCGHVLHRECFDEMIRHHFTCPTCNKALCDLTKYYARLDEEVAETPMPVAYSHLVVEVLCNECQQKTIAPFSVVGAKCQACGVYNTVKVRGPFAK